jgi:hypothetical protein
MDLLSTVGFLTLIIDSAQEYQYMDLLSTVGF